MSCINRPDRTNERLHVPTISCASSTSTTFHDRHCTQRGYCFRMQNAKKCLYVAATFFFFIFFSEYSKDHIVQYTQKKAEVILAQRHRYDHVRKRPRLIVKSIVPARSPSSNASSVIPNIRFVSCKESRMQRRQMKSFHKKTYHARSKRIRRMGRP